MKTAIEITVLYNDGTEDYALGETAQQVWNFLMSGQAMQAIHGVEYSGKRMTLRDSVTKKPAERKEEL